MLGFYKMTVKCVAIGNRIMEDDCIGIKVVEKLSSKMMKEGIELIIGETDSDYSLSLIEDGDLLIIIDSTYLGIIPGTVTVAPIDKLTVKNQIFSQHQPNLINLLDIYRKKVNGYVIGIEVEKIDFNLELSNTLKNKLPQICKEVDEFICKTIYNNQRLLFIPET